MVTTMAKDLYAIGEQPPLGEVPPKMNAWLIRENRFGQPTSSFQKEVVDVPSIKDDEVLVYVMAAGINYNNVWAALGIPVNVIKARAEGGREGRLPHRRLATPPASSTRSARTSRTSRSATRSWSTAATWDPQRSLGEVAGNDPMYAPSFRIWGYETNYGSFAQFTKVQAHQCMPKPKHMTWEEAAAYVLVGATAWRMLHGWPEHEMQPGDPVLIWGGAGGLGSMAIQIAKAAGAIPVAVVSGDDKIDYCMKLGAKGCINRRKFDHWGMLPHWKDTVGYNNWLKGVRAFGAAIWEVLGEKRSPKVDLRASRRVDDPDLDLRLRHRRHGRHLRRHHRLQRDRRPALPVDAAEALPGLALRQRRAVLRDERAGAAPASSIPACRAPSPTTNCRSAHQLMHDNKHPHGNMSVLIGAPGLRPGQVAPRRRWRSPRPTLPKGDLHDPRSHPYPVSAPLPGVEPALEGDSRSTTTAPRSANACTPASSPARADDTLGRGGARR